MSEIFAFKTYLQAPLNNASALTMRTSDRVDYSEAAQSEDDQYLFSSCGISAQPAPQPILKWNLIGLLHRLLAGGYLRHLQRADAQKQRAAYAARM